MDNHKEQAEDLGTRPQEEPEMVIDSLELFDGRREIYIVLDGVRYRLRITRRNKLILQK